MLSKQEGTRGIRTPQWAFFKRYAGDNAPDLPDELFNLAIDPDEETNFAQDPEHAHIVADLSAQIEVFFVQHSRENADMWTGGKPIQNSMMKSYWAIFWGTIGRLFIPMTSPELVAIPPTQFVMGAADAPQPEDGESPTRLIDLSAYRIGTTAVSNADFARFVEATNYQTEAERCGGSQVFKGRLQDPDAHLVLFADAPWWRWIERAAWNRPNGTPATMRCLAFITTRLWKAMQALIRFSVLWTM